VYVYMQHLSSTQCPVGIDGDPPSTVFRFTAHKLINHCGLLVLCGPVVLML